MVRVQPRELSAQVDGDLEQVAASLEDPGMASYKCCECETDMTEAVLVAAQALRPVFRTSTHAGPLQRRDASAAQSVRLTCPNGHMCTYRLSDD